VSISLAVEQLLAMPEESSRRVFLQQNPHLQHQSMVVYLASQVPTIARNDVDRALQLAGLASWLAEILNDDYCRARSARAMGHPLQLKGKHRESLLEYQKALDLFTKLNLESEVGITLSGSLQPLILLGNYEESRLREESRNRTLRIVPISLARAGGSWDQATARVARTTWQLGQARPLSIPGSSGWDRWQDPPRLCKCLS
jgi:hypothetical protein